MKITTSKKFLKKIILILCLVLSYFLFIDKPKAQTNLDFKYNSTITTNTENCQLLYENVSNYIRRNATTFEVSSDIDIQNDKTILLFGFQNYNSCPTNGLIRVGLLYDITQTTFNYFYTNRYNYSMTYYNFQLSFDAMYNITGITEIPSSQTSYSSWTSSPQLDFYFDYHLGKNSTLTFNYSGTSDNLVVNSSDLIINANTNTTNLYDVIKKLDSAWIIPSEPTISYEVINGNGYSDVKFIANGYTPTTIQDYNIKVINLNSGNYTQQTLQPSQSGDTDMTIRVYEPTTFYYYVENINTQEKIQEEYITIGSLNFSDLNIEILDINKDNKSIKYKYTSNGNINNFTCTHQISGEQEISDTNCNISTSEFNLIIGGNKSVTFRIYYNNVIQLESTIPFVFSQGTPYITFNEVFDDNITSLKVFLNSYNTNNYNVKYTINNGQEITPQLTQEPSNYNDKYSFIVWNITENTKINVYVYDLNNNLISSSYYEYNSIKIKETTKEDYNGVKGFFNRLKISNISDELKTIVQNFSTVIMSTRLGTIFILMATITILGFILSLLRR